MGESFHYSYSAADQAEIEAIRKKYLPKEEYEDKLEQLRRLDAGVEKPGLIAAITLGIIGTLVLGVGMCCILVWSRMALGIVIAVVGFAGVLYAYPLYTRMTAKRREQIAPEILRLTEELSQK